MANTQVRQHVQIKAQTDGLSSTGTYLGNEYIIVPVVAMVEGVRFGMNQSAPELGLAEEFGKFPAGWNNRPIVMNHPEVDGQLVSANSPAVLEAFAFGFTADADIVDGKLKLNAWIDPQRTDTIGGDAPGVITRVNAGEIIEVSVGFFSDVEEVKGTFKGQSYSAIWRNIVPDHLAFLSEGVKGACSIEAGCGTPRVNQESSMPKPQIQTSKQTKPNTQGNTTHPRTVKDILSDGKTKGDMGGSLDHKMPGGGGIETEVIDQPTKSTPSGSILDAVNTLDNQNNSATTSSAIGGVSPTGKKTKAQSKTDCGCGGHSHSHSHAQAGEPLVANALKAQEHFTGLMNKALMGALLDVDMRSIIADELSERFGYCYLIGFTPTDAVFERYDDMSGSFETYQIGYSINGVEVTLADTPVNVTVIMTIVPEGDESMTTKTDDTTVPVVPNATAVMDQKTAAAAATTTTEATPAVQAAKPLTVQQYLDQAPDDLKDVLASGLKMHTEKKNSLIKDLKATNRCKFSDAALNAMSMNDLESLAELAAVPDYSGRRGAEAPVTQASTDNFVEAPKVFQLKKTA